MSENKRRWFQIHLSTAIVLMFIASGVLWANVQTMQFMYARHTPLPNGGMDFGDFIGDAYGWPFFCFWLMHDTTEWDPKRFGLDLATATALLIAGGAVCEWRIRRRQVGP